jgi:hypothetical protein
MRAYIMITLAGKQQKTPNWLNRKKIESKVATVLHTSNTEILSAMTPAKDHQHHMITITIKIHDVTMIVAARHHNIAPTPKHAVRAALVTTTEKVHHSTTTRKDTKNKHTHLGITNKISIDQQHMNHTQK